MTPIARWRMDDDQRSLSGWGRVRLVAGTVLLVATGLVAVLYVGGAWNPGRLVVLEYRFGNPVRGALLVSIGAFAGLWLAFPVRNEARHRARIGVRMLAGVLILLSFSAHQLVGDHFTFEATVLDRSADGSRAVVDVRDRDRPPNSYLRVWAGSGLGAREVGEVGRVCGAWSAELVGTDRILIHATYSREPWVIDLDPDTGVPLQRLGPRCSDGPVPATLGR